MNVIPIAINENCVELFVQFCNSRKMDLQNSIQNLRLRVELPNRATTSGSKGKIMLVD